MTSWVPFDLLDHLWQSTLFTAAVWLVARAVRTNAARVRYWLWFAASLKFLVPISVLVSVGERFAWRTTPAAAPAVASVIEQVLTPAATTVAATAPAVPIVSSTTVWPVVLLAAWGIGVAFVLTEWWRQWRPIRRALRDARPIDLRDDKSLTVLASASMVEPGVFGIWRPVLLVPEGIGDRLTPAQLRALIAHERCHIRHHDNLTAALHMAVEALFWFHPLVWWLERRLIEERERACDEYVLQSGSTPRDYAEGILEVCRFAKDPSPVFVAGITGADLRRRIESILSHETARPLGLRQGATLLVCAAAAVVGPVAAGAVQSTKPAQVVENRPRFEVASIKRTPEVTGPGADFAAMPGGRLHARNNAVANLIGNAYDIPQYRMANTPDWARSERYDLEGKAVDANATRPQLMLMLQTLLEDRLRLRWHRETREGPVYVLSVARGGHKLRASKDGGCGGDLEQAKLLPAPAPGRASRVCGNNWLNGSGPNIVWSAYSIDLEKVAGSLAVFTGRTVVNKTGVSGRFDIDIELPRLQPLAGADLAPADADAFTVLREQLGLELQPGKGPLEYFVVDSIAKPSEN
jgi:bla regulator protein BlaR1